MKFSSAIVLGAASLASAQSIGSLVSQIPTCADACLLKYIPMVCSGGITDYACSCMADNKAKITMDSTTCIVDACQVQKALMVQSLTNEICSVYSKDGSGSSASATMSSSMSSSMASATSSSMMESSSMMSSMASSSMASSSMASSSMAMSTPASSASSASSAAMSASSSVAAVTNGASRPVVTAAPALAAAAAAMLML